MCDPVSIGEVAVAAYGVYSQQQAAGKSLDAQKAASAATIAAANKQADAVVAANNAANSKQPDVAAIAGANSQQGKGGASGTLLTGAQGIDPKQLTLGKATLLGA